MVNAVKFAIPCTFCLGNAALVGSNWVFKSEKLVEVKEEADWKEKLNKLAEKLGHDGNKEAIIQIIAGDNEKDKLKLNAPKDFENEKNAKEVLQKWCKDPTEGKEYVDELCKKYEQRNWLFG